MTKEVNVIKIDGVRKPDYEGDYIVMRDDVDTMIIKINNTEIMTLPNFDETE